MTEMIIEIEVGGNIQSLVITKKMYPFFIMNEFDSWKDVETYCAKVLRQVNETK